MSIENALASLRDGKMIAVYDGDEREGETDLIFAAQFASAQKIEILRRDAGGLICLAVSSKTAQKLKLPFYTDILEASNLEIKKLSCTKTAYGDKPAFSIAINHKQVYTGITDNDRALTISKFDEISTNTPENFEKEFYSPGHVFLLISRGIENRKGHTELAVELGLRAKLAGNMVLCEMLGSGRAKSKKEVIDYCKKNGIEFIEGKDIINEVE